MIRCAVILCLCALVASTADAGDWGSQALSAPPDVDVIIMVDRAATLHAGASGQTLSELVSAALPLTTTTGAWKTLADLLGMPQDRVFDALLGRRAVYFGRWTDDGSFQWAIRSEVDPKTAFKLLNRLGAKPKEIKHGHPVALIENGRFEITSSVHKKSATLLFGPRSSSDLLAGVLARFDAHKRASLRDNEDFSRAVQLAPDDGSVFVFLQSQTQPTSWFSATANLIGQTIDVQLAASIQRTPLPKTTFSTAQWRHFSKGSLVAMVEPFAVDELPLGSLLDRLGAGDLRDAPLPLDGRVALNVSQQTPNELSLTVGVETSNIDLLAGIGDIALASVASNLASSSSKDQSQDAPSLDTLSGAFPETVRSIALTRSASQGAAPANPLGDGDLTLVWSYQTIQGRSDRRGWGIVSNSVAAYRHAAASLTTPGSDAKDAVTPFSFYSAKPAKLIEAMEAAHLISTTPTPLVQSLRLIDSIESATTFQDGLLRGQATLILKKKPKE